MKKCSHSLLVAGFFGMAVTATSGYADSRDVPLATESGPNGSATFSAHLVEGQNAVPLNGINFTGSSGNNSFSAGANTNGALSGGYGYGGYSAGGSYNPSTGETTGSVGFISHF